MATVSAGNLATAALGALLVKMAWETWVIGQTPVLSDTDYTTLGLGLAAGAAYLAERGRLWADRAHEVRVAKALRQAGIDPASVEFVPNKGGPDGGTSG